MLVLVVGLQGIPDDLFEAAALDGATRGQTFRYVTLPLLRPSLSLALILCVTGSLLAFVGGLMRRISSTVMRGRWTCSTLRKMCLR